MGNIGPWQLLIVLAIVLVLFGAKRLPEAARGLGRSLKIFKTETQGLVSGDDDDKGSDDSGDHTTSSSAQQSQRAVEPPSTAQSQSGEPVNEQSKNEA